MSELFLNDFPTPPPHLLLEVNIRRPEIWTGYRDTGLINLLLFNNYDYQVDIFNFMENYFKC